MSSRSMAGAGWLAAAVLGSPAHGQGAKWIVEVDWIAFPSEATVTVSARIDPSDYAFAGAQFDLEYFGDGEVEWRDMEALLDQPGHPGVGGFRGVTGIVVGQIHRPPWHFADPQNPIPVWRGTVYVIDVCCGWGSCVRTATEEFTVYPLESELFAEPRNAMEAADRVIPPGPPPDCYADCDHSGSLDFFDFLCFQNRFATGHYLADCNLDCVLDVFDFLCFQNEFSC